MHITLTKKGFFYLFSIKVFHIPNEMHGGKYTMLFFIKVQFISFKNLVSFL